MKIKDIAGLRFGRLVAIRPDGNNSDKKIMWECLCDCGKIHRVAGTNLRSGSVKSCGCFLVDRLKASNTKHGHSKGYKSSRTYKSYQAMMQRCHNPNHTAYHNYGGRGILVCNQWRESFSDFLADMGERPVGCELDRTDNNKGYSPDNCKWVSRKANASNRRNNRLLVLAGDVLTLTDWSRKTEISVDVLWHRLQSGWSVEKTLTQPVRRHTER